MSRVVIIHAAEDTLPARALAEKLRQVKLDVVLEKPAGEEQRHAIGDARVTIALWSPRSAEQPAIAEDVAFAQAKGALIHAVMQSAPVPEQFRRGPGVNLSGWRGEDDFPGWRNLLKLVAAKTGVAAPPPPAARAASGFFTPGRTAAAATTAAPTTAARRPQPAMQAAPRAQAAAPSRAPPPPRPVAATSASPQRQAPVYASEPDEPEEKKNGLMIGVIALAAVAVLGGGGFFVWSQQQGGANAQAAWEAVDTSEADALRAFLAGVPGDYRDDAAAALANLEERTFEAASDADTIDALQAFVGEFPDSEHALVARGRIAELQTSSADAVPAADAAAPLEETLTIDADLVPPATTPEASSGGPATITPPPTDTPAPAPAPAPVRVAPPAATPPN